ncbi:alkaline phosphatase [Virgibacillus necropolis]|uniref:Alkaline phosphatase n=1 Tax=Virgibacillus necropolis TaxID=163877 RepID=A0A221MBF1_9BACI|nr:DeoR family transcriptional regulator [Virgibacillus necropolis]ASN04939.1 alkaline phosphatase [Virgibacillus necropolis]
MEYSSSRMLTRMKAVYFYIKECGMVSTPELAEEFNTTMRTIQRDLHVLTYNGLVSSPTRGKWKITDKKVSIS